MSEVDIIFNTHDDSKGGGVQLYDSLTQEMKLNQAKKYADLVKIYQDIVPKEQQYGITFWGFNDRDTWIRRFFDMNDSTSPEPEGFPQTDNFFVEES